MTSKKGINKKAPIKKKVSIKSSSVKNIPNKKNTKFIGTCFVMMPFKEPFNIYYENIFKPAIKETKLDPIRTDDLFRPSVIVSDIWEMIQESKVIVAELTTKNANVFYELGLAHAIGKAVVLVSETMEDVPFDLQQLRIILYDKDDPSWGNKLSHNIMSAINETLKSPIESVPNIFRKNVKSHTPKQNTTLARIESLEKQFSLLRSTPNLIDFPFPYRSFKDNDIGILNDLADVNNIIDLTKWIKKWSKYASSDQLESIILKNNILPNEKVFKIKNLIKNTINHNS